MMLDNVGYQPFQIGQEIFAGLGKVHSRRVAIGHYDASNGGGGGRHHRVGIRGRVSNLNRMRQGDGFVTQLATDLEQTFE